MNATTFDILLNIVTGPLIIITTIRTVQHIKNTHKYFRSKPGYFEWITEELSYLAIVWLFAASVIATLFVELP